MKTLALVLSIMVIGNVLANNEDSDTLSIPTVDLVTTIHEFCLEQNTALDESDLESVILKCVNNDLKISTYKTFNTYAELTSFISKEKESEL